MKQGLLVALFIIYGSNFCWAMEAQESRRIENYYRQKLSDLMSVKSHDSATEEYRILLKKDLKSLRISSKEYLEIINKYQQPPKDKILRICEQTISGNDWLVLSPCFVNLSTIKKFVVPSDWESYNCQIEISDLKQEHGETTLTLKITPDLLPGLSDYKMPDCTWKAVVWLNEIIISRKLSATELEEKIAELNLSRANVDREAAIIIKILENL